MERIKRLRQILTDPKNDLEKAQRKLVFRIAVTVVTALIVIAIIFAMTTAWYSNTIQMNAISVQSDSWNFTGKISIVGEAKDGSFSLGEGIRPGDGGVIPITIENNDEQAVDIRVETDKSSLSDTMKKRLYFYVETTETGEDGVETTTRTYLNSRGGYLYGQIPASATEILTGEEAPEPDENADEIQTLAENQLQTIYGTSLVRWEWVYDVTGYFVLGTVKEEKNGETDEVTGVLEMGDNKEDDTPAPEYLMPVSYDLDQAVFDKDGQLESVSLPKEADSLPKEADSKDGADEGETEERLTREEYLSRLFAAVRSYRGLENAEYIPKDKATADKPATQQIGNFYAVDVDDGYGVWLYLGSWDDITAETAVDAAIGTEKTAEDQSSVKLIFKGQNSKSEPEQEDDTAE